MQRWTVVGTATLAIAACGPVQEQRTDNAPANQAVLIEGNTAIQDRAALPDDRTPLEEPRGPIDPKSVEAAGQVVQSFGALIEQKRWVEAERLWGNAATASAFTAGLKRNRESHLEIGKPGDPEGAAGSIFVTVPVVFYGQEASGSDFRRGADVILRRVNDVPGSTEAQRRWHIERVDWNG